jgi:hypothetical protein
MTQEEMMLKKGYLSAATAAKRVGRARYTVQRWFEQGHVAGTKAGARIYVSIESLKGYLGHDATAMLGLKGL